MWAFMLCSPFAPGPEVSPVPGLKAQSPQVKGHWEAAEPLGGGPWREEVKSLGGMASKRMPGASSFLSLAASCTWYSATVLRGSTEQPRTGITRGQKAGGADGRTLDNRYQSTGRRSKFQY